jgi:hypothetical protein
VWGAQPHRRLRPDALLPALEAHVVARHRATALHLLRTVVRSQRWGVAARAARRLALYFKGGWGSGTGSSSTRSRSCARARSRRGGRADQREPDRAYGEQTLRGVFARLLRGLARRTS